MNILFYVVLVILVLLILALISLIIVFKLFTKMLNSISGQEVELQTNLYEAVDRIRASIKILIPVLITVVVAFLIIIFVS